MKVAIFEDEILSADYLKTILTKIDPQIEVVYTIESIKEAISLISNGINIDLAFVDIHLSDGNSFDIFSKVDVNFPLIFTTAYDEYALKAFKLNSIDYLLKPLGKKEVEQALNKFKQLREQNISLYKLEKEIFESPKYKYRFIVKIGESIIVIHIDEVSYFISESSYTYIYTTNGRKFIIDFKLDELETLLNPKTFHRISRKTIININSIEKVNSYFNSRLIVISKYLTKENSIVSRERVPLFKKWLEGEDN